MKVSKWVEQHCQQHTFLVSVPLAYIQDNFNLTGLNSYINSYNLALDIILDLRQAYCTETELLYGLIHSRYILTKDGLMAILHKYEAGIFGYCPRVYCHKQPVLPVGEHIHFKKSTVKLFCPQCNDLYHSDYNLDGAYFGPTCAHVLKLTYPITKKNTNSNDNTYIPKIYGFKIHQS